MNGWTKMLETIAGIVSKIGPWTLVVIIMLAWLAGEYGFLESQTKKTAEAFKEHVTQSQTQSQQTQQTLDKIVTVLEEQRRIQAQAGLIACFKEAKWDSERTECIRKFPIK